MRKIFALLVFVLATTCANAQTGFDHSHALWNEQVKKNVHWSADGSSSSVDYAGFKKDHAVLKKYLASLSAVKLAAFQGWNQNQQSAFLINAYNAYTVELILTKYPNLKSIKDLGNVFSSPWSKPFFSLLGQKRSLDDVEHKLLRGAKGFDEPRIHFAVNCASIGCPALRPEAFDAEKLNAQLEDQTRRFLSDRGRNRFDKAQNTLLLSSIFDWYGDDFSKGVKAGSLPEFLARYAGSLGLSNGEKMRLQKSEIEIDFLDYDWSLNVKK